jgi:polyhydroxybutyrate depolymerase
MEQLTRFSDIAGRGFIVVYPDGIGRSWNAGHGVGLAESAGVDDVGFIARLIDLLTHEFNIDQRRIYAAGISNGGMFAYRLACELNNRIAAVASVAGSLPPDIARNCSATGPISVLHIHGTADRIVPWAGGETTSGGRILSVDATVAQSAKTAKCDNEPIITLQTGRVACKTYRGCATEAEVGLCRIEGGGHTWPGSQASAAWESIVGPTNEDVNASDIIWLFFSRHTRPDTQRGSGPGVGCGDPRH